MSGAPATGSGTFDQADEESTLATFPSSGAVDSQSASPTASMASWTQEVDAGGRMLQDTSSQHVTTTLEITFVTDIHVSQALLFEIIA